MDAAAMTQSIQEMFIGGNLAIGASVGNASRRAPMAEGANGGGRPRRVDEPFIAPRSWDTLNTEHDRC
jgi:hypothetical protein